MHIVNLNSFLQDILALSFPSYNGKKFLAHVQESVNCSSYWEGGSRNYYAIVSLRDGKAYESRIAPAQSPFDKRDESLGHYPTSNETVIVEHTIFCGRDMGITFHVHPSLKEKLPQIETVTLTPNERIVLEYTRSRKSSYGGVSNLRFVEANKDKGISLDDWNRAVNSCIGKGLLRKNKSITVEGRNALTS